MKSVDLYREYEENIAEKCSIRKLRSISDVNIDQTTAVLRFENVTFRYPGGDLDTLHNISFDLAPGEKLAVVGLNESPGSRIPE